jgi:hypothetical protein
MTDTATASALDRATDHAAKCWRLFTDNRNMRSRLGVWETSSTPDGSRLVSAEVTGSGAAYALARFAADYHINLPNPGDVRPQFDVTAVGRTVLVWRCLGVWVELWVSDAQTLTPTPAPARTAAVEAAAETPLLSGPTRRPAPRPGLGARLPFARNRRTTDKETTRS